MKPVCPKEPGGEELAAVSGVRGLDVEAEGADVAVAVVARTQQRLDSERREDPRRAELPAGENHPAETGEVVRRREEPGVPGDPADGPRARIVHLAAEPAALDVLGRRDPRYRRARGERPEGRLPHAERTEERSSEQTVEGLARHAANELAQNLVADVRVDEARAGRPGERLPRLPREDLLGRPRVELERIVGREPGAVNVGAARP